MNILITGGLGQLANALKKNKRKNINNKFFFTSKKNLDITNYKEIKNFIIEKKINIIINCAAYTDVDKAQINRKIANKVNNLSVKNLAILSKKYKVLLIQISTDYVFSSNSKKYFYENDTRSPINHYGITKLKGENQIFKYKPNSIIIRTSWLYSEFSNNFVKTIYNLIKKGRNIELKNNSYGSPTNANDLAKFIYLILSKKYLFLFEKNLVFHYSNLGCISRYLFIKKIIQYSKVSENIKIIKKLPLDSSYNIRPACSCIRSNNLNIIKEFNYIKWDKSLLRCINKIKKNEKN